MPRPATGTIVERRNASGGINRSLRFSVNGRKRSVALGPVSRDEAERRLRQELADVERGAWKPPATTPSVVQTDVPTFHAYAEQWWLRNASRLGAGTQVDYRARLERHSCLLR